MATAAHCRVPTAYYHKVQLRLLLLIIMTGNACSACSGDADDERLHPRNRLSSLTALMLHGRIYALAG
jgi:hypothetical protein